jgi:hypothetical protein
MENDFENVSGFAVGSILSRTWTVLWARPAAFLGLAFLLLIIPESIRSAFLRMQVSVMFGEGGTIFLLLNQVIGPLLHVTFILAFQGVVTHMTFQIIMKNRVSVRESVRRAFSRTGTLLLISVNAFIGLSIMQAITAMTMIVLAYIFRILPGSDIAVGIAGTFFLIVSTGVVISSWCVAVPVCLAERAGALESLGRSWRLTKGHRLKIFGMFALVCAIILIISRVVDRVTADTLGNEFIAPLIDCLANIIPIAFVILTPPVAYYSLRATKA